MTTRITSPRPFGDDPPDAQPSPGAAARPRDGRAGTALAVYVLAGALIVAHVALAWYLRVPSLTNTGDDTAYVLLARSIRDGGYHSFYFIGAPLHTTFPPLYPALLAVLGALGGESVDVFAGASAFLSAAALYLLFDVARQRWPPEVALSALTLAAIHPETVRMAGWVASEPPFAALTSLSLWAVAREPLPRRAAALGAAAAVGAALVRLPGLTVVIAVLLALVAARRRRDAAVIAAVLLAGAIAVVVTTQAVTGHAAGYHYFLDRVGRSADPPLSASLLLQQTVSNVRDYAHLVTVLLVPNFRPGVIAKLTAAAFLTAGLWSLWRRWRAAALFLLCYGLLLATWRWAVPRFLVPAIPLVLLTAVVVVSALGARWSARAARAAPVLFALLVAAPLVREGVQAMQRQRTCDRRDPTRSPGCYSADERSLFEAARFVRSATAADARFVASKPTILHFYAQRQAVPSDSVLSRAPEAFADLLARYRVSHVLLARTSAADPWVRMRLLAVCDRLEVVRIFPPYTALFRVVLDRPPTRDNAACEFLTHWRTGP